MVFQNYTLYPWLTVAENILFSATLKARRGDAEAQIAAKVRCEALLHLMGLETFCAGFSERTIGRHEAASCHRAGAASATCHSADGRAIRGARRADARGDATAHRSAQPARRDDGHYGDA